MEMYTKMRNKIGFIGLITLLMLLSVSASAQQVVVMPHNGTDSLTINRQNCYTILDPGGLSNYANNEDSWLQIHSTSGNFLLRVTYETSASGDCSDYIDIFQGTDSTASSRRFCGFGSDTWYCWSNDALIHFHSNAYASFSGFEIAVYYPGTIYNWSDTALNDSTVALTWDDSESGATEWTITYYCDEDTLLTFTSTTPSATLTGLRNNTYYAYHIENDATACMETAQQYFIAQHPDTQVYIHPTGGALSLTSGQCYTLNAASGPGSNTLSVNRINTAFSTADSTGFYADGWSRNNYFNATWYTGYGFGSNISYWDQNNIRRRRLYFPHGYGSFNLTEDTKLQYTLTWENNHIIVPTVSALTATTATISWTDTTSSSSWTVRYTSSEGSWSSQTVTSPTITLSGLQAGTQYLYTIEGNVSPACVTPYRHAFITSGSADTLIMPYRGSDTLVLQSGSCYTLVDAGKEGGYYHSDFSAYTLTTANGKGFRLKGWYDIASPDILYVYHNGQWDSYSGSNSNLELYCADGTCTIGFSSDPEEIGMGFAFDIIQLDSTITDLQATAITQTGATLSWSDPTATTGWQVHYGYEEGSFATVSTTSPTVTLTGLLPGTQYVYYVTRQGSNSPCQYPDRQAFITHGLDTHTVIMPYRGIDTLYYTPGECYTILDPGGSDYDYFNYDTSLLVIVSTDSSDFYLTGGFDYEDVYDLKRYGYDYNDLLETTTDTSGSAYYSQRMDGGWTHYNGNQIRIASENGYLRLRWRTNDRTVRKGFYLHIDQDANAVADVTFPHIKSTTAEVSWNDNSGYSGPWYLSYTADSVWTTVTSSSSATTLTGLQPSTLYSLRISRTATSDCGIQTHTFATLSATDIVMNAHARDTVWITPGNCYTVYDPGGEGDYYASDTSVLVIRSTTGLGFRLHGQADVSDLLSFESDGSNATSYWWGIENYYPEGIAYITLTTNEAINDHGFAFRVTFYPTLDSLDTLWRNDTAMAIAWHDTSAATQWTVTYGTHIDSLQTLTTTTPQATLTGLHRNAQCYIDIESDFSASDCIMRSIYGIRTPHDPDIWLTQYRNYYLGAIGRNSLVQRSIDTIPTTGCLHIYDNGGFNPTFPNSSEFHLFTSADGRDFTIEGEHDLGSGYLYTYASPTYSYQYDLGEIKLSSSNGSLELDLRTPEDPNECGKGFDFEVAVNYGIFQITPSAVTCSTATLSWVDTSGATQWWVAYGEQEGTFDTVTTTTRSCSLTSLTPDRQYVCYLWSNEGISTCKAPVRTFFLTTCDTTIIIMPFNVDTSRTLDINACYTLMDNGGPRNYHHNSSQVLNLQSSSGDPITIRGFAHIRSGDRLTIYDPDNFTWDYYDWSGEKDDFEFTSTSGKLYLRFNSNADTLNDSGFEFAVSFQTIGNIRTDLMTDTTCRFRWDDNSSATQWTFWYGTDLEQMDSIVTNTKTVHLDHLVNDAHYHVCITNNAVECIDTTWYEFCAGGSDCIDYASIYSCHTQCRYGTFANPDSYTGVVDYGPDSIYSRHTVMLDTSYRDPRTGGLLRSIPEGYDYAVRLGNWNNGGEEESITYEYIVDTANNDILLLRYAAVLENPDHQPEDQPRFRFAIVDEYDNPINTECYYADFVSSGQLNWNSYVFDSTTVLWKDWTAVGIDLAPLHGQRIFVRLTTYDCAQTGHFGYAYFTLSCDRKYILTGACGQVDTNNFTAPEGFRYQWYNIDSASVILDTDRVFYSAENGIYKCRASFVGNTSSNCYFEKTVVVGNLFPYANFDYHAVDTNGCRTTLRFQNLSRVATDSAYTNITSMECESFLWDFGDGDTSYQQHPTHIFDPGYYYVRLTAMLANGDCTKDTTVLINVPSPCIQYDTLYPAICDGDTFTLGDSSFTQTGTYIVRQGSGDSISETLVYLTVHPVYDFYLTDTLCNNQQYDSYGILVPVGATAYSTTEYTHTFTSTHTCDSTYHLTLTVLPAYDTVDTAVVCSDQGYALSDSTVYLSGSYIDSLHTTDYCDSVVHLSLTVNPAYHFYADDTICGGTSYPYFDSVYTTSGQHVYTLLTAQGCDSAYHLDLTINPSYHFYDTVFLCRQEPYYHNGQPYYAPDIIIDSFVTANGCDSLYYTVLELHDSLFAAHWEVSDDTVYWCPITDTLWEGCAPYTLYFRNRSIHAASGTWTLYNNDTTIHLSDPIDSTTYLSYSFDVGRHYFYFIVTDASGCSDTLVNPTGVSVLPSPIASFYWDSTLVSEIHPFTSFHNTSVPLDSTCSSLWLIGRQPDSEDDLDSIRETNPIYQWNIEGVTPPANYLVWLIMTQQQIGITGDTLFCTDTVQDTIKLMPCTLEYSNFVTPNGDGVNDIFKIKNLLEYGRFPYNKLTVYDRWGHEVYKVVNISKESDFWDPNLTGSPTGTYYYRFTGNGRDGAVQHNGVIEVLSD